MNTSSKISAVLAYLLLVVGWLYVLLLRREDRLATFHVRQSIGLVLLAIAGPLIWAVVGWLWSLIPSVGPLIAIALFSFVIALYIVLAIAWVVGLIYALQAREQPLPIVGAWANRLPVGRHASPPEYH